MMIIPFGLIGTIWGHYVWDVPLSMFTVVGLIGMTGIIINDSIVLVTTIDEYAKTRGLLPAVIDATADRLRPVMLTTLTTVLGLMPLLYETSSQAQFLKPTVITLSYGLSFGLLLVLLVVPSMVIVQQDVGHLFRALRRGLTGRRVGFAQRGLLVVTTVLAVGLSALTLGYWAFVGEVSGFVGFVSGFTGMTGFGASFVTLLIGLALIYVVSVLVAAAMVGRGKRVVPAE